MPLTDSTELAEVDSALRHIGAFHPASQHITQALSLLGDRDNPDFRNAIKEAISAVESSVSTMFDTPRDDIAKGLAKLDGHPQLKQAWKNMYRWTSDEQGIRHSMADDPNIGLDEARYMVVICSAFVNYLVAKHAEGS